MRRRALAVRAAAAATVPRAAPAASAPAARRPAAPHDAAGPAHEVRGAVVVYIPTAPRPTEHIG